MPDLLVVFKAASEKIVILLDITHVQKGSVTDAYEASKVSLYIFPAIC